MSFERTQNAIMSLSEYNSIPLEQMYDLLTVIVKDVCAFDNVRDASEINPENKKLLLKRILSIMSMCYSSYDKNRDTITEFLQETRGKFADMEKRYSTLQEELSKYVADIETFESKEQELNELHSECMEKNEQLRKIKAHCSEMQAEIDEMSDLNLAELESKESSLKEELTARLKKHNELESNIKETHAQVDTISKEIETLSIQDNALAEEFDNKQSEKISMEENIKSLQTQISEINAWIEAYPEYSKSIEEEFAELDSKVKIAINAWNSVKAEEFLTKVLSENHDAQFFNNTEGISGLDDINAWFENLLKYFEKLSKHGNERVNCLTKEISKITQPLEKQLSE